MLISFRIDDILADSDSDMSLDEEVETGKKQKGKKNLKNKKKEPETYIHETEDGIVDLADTDGFSRITSKKFMQILYQKINF